MGANTKIEWTDATWTPIRARHWEIQSDGSGRERIGWHCEHVSEGCRNCYSEAINRRLGTGLDFKPGNLFREERRGSNNGESRLFLDEEMLFRPLRWKRSRMIFVCSMTDLFADFVPDEWIDRMFAVMALAPQHTFQVLTKRSARMRQYLTRIEEEPTHDTVRRIVAAWPNDAPTPKEGITFPLPNVWLGVSAEDQKLAEERVPDLLMTPAAVRFVSAEPLLGPVRLDRILLPSGDHLNAFKGIWMLESDTLPRVDWVIAGGESGTGARPMHPDWARSLRDQCAAAGVAFHFKQWGEWLPWGQKLADGNENYLSFGKDPKLFRHLDPGEIISRVGKKAAGRLLDGVEHNAFPQVPA